ncbi:MAG: insulinase family protein [Dehalococcoidia bacterium]|nr:insulinase family protein [Dehalococcoidia bacterium]
MFEKTVLANGMPVFTVKMPQVRSVSVAYFFGAGSRYEQDDEAGASHFLEHLLFKGTPRRPLAQEISGAIERVGGYMNAATDREVTTYWTKVARPYFPEALDLLSDMVMNSVYDAKEMERERKVILEEISSVNDSPGQKVDVLIDQAVFPGQPLGRDVAGTRESVEGITREMILDYAASQYCPNNGVLAVAGDLEHNDVVEAVSSQIGAWQPKVPRSWIPADQSPREPTTVVENRRTEQAHFCLAMRGLSSRHPARYALDLLNVVLGEGMSSRLFVELREKNGLAYEVHSSVSHFLDDGMVTLYAGVDPARIHDAISRAIEELHRLKEPIPDDELDKAKAMVKGRMLLRTEDTRSMASWTGIQQLLAKEVRTIDDVVKIIDAITVEDLQNVAAEVITPEKLSLAVVGPFRSQARFERDLKR